MDRRSCGLEQILQGSKHFKPNFTLDDIELQASPKFTASVTRDGSTWVAICCGSILTIVSSHADGTCEISSDLEFDGDLVDLVWDPNGQCVICCQRSGLLHFVTAAGQLMLSHSILPQSKPNFSHISLFRTITS